MPPDSSSRGHKSLIPCEHLFSNIMAKIDYISFDDDDDVRFVLDQHA